MKNKFYIAFLWACIALFTMVAGAPTWLWVVLFVIAVAIFIPEDHGFIEKSPARKTPKQKTRNLTLKNKQLAILWDMASAALEDDRISQTEAKMLLGHMSSVDGMDKDHRTRRLYQTLKISLYDGILDEFESEEIKTLLSDFCDAPTQSAPVSKKYSQPKQSKSAINQKKHNAKNNKFKKKVYKQATKTPNPDFKGHGSNNNNFVGFRISGDKTPSSKGDDGFIDYRVSASDIPASEYSFDYVDGNDNPSHRKVIFKSTKESNGCTYLNGICLGRNAHRTFRADRITNLVDVDTGEAVSDAESYFLSLN